MEITYIGHSCFKIKGKTSNIVIDPYDPAKVGYKLPKLEADILLSTHDHFDHNHTSGVSGYKLLIDQPGEYETLDVFVMGIETFHDDESGAERGKNTMFLIEMEGFNLLHTGDLGHELNKDTLEKLPNIDVLMIPVGGTYTIDHKVAAKVISAIEPSVVIPMHYQTDDLTGLSKPLLGLEKFLDEMGADKNLKKEDKLKLSSKHDLPEEAKVVVLAPQH